VTPRHVRYICVRLKALRNNPRLLLRSPSSPPLPPRNHLHPLISANFVPGIKHGSYHRTVSRNQRRTANIAGNPGAREVGRSNPLRLNKLSALELEPVRRYEREHPGELIHIDIKKLGRIDSESAATADRRNISGLSHLRAALICQLPIPASA
jgi:hypothetical protein